MQQALCGGDDFGHTIIIRPKTKSTSLPCSMDCLGCRRRVYPKSQAFLPAQCSRKRDLGYRIWFQRTLATSASKRGPRHMHLAGYCIGPADASCSLSDVRMASIKSWRLKGLFKKRTKGMSAMRVVDSCSEKPLISTIGMSGKRDAASGRFRCHPASASSGQGGPGKCLERDRPDVRWHPLRRSRSGL